MQYDYRPILLVLGKLGSAVVDETPDTRKDGPTVAQSVPNPESFPPNRINFPD